MSRSKAWAMGLATILAASGRAQEALDAPLQALLEVVLLARERHVDADRATSAGPVRKAMAAFLGAFGDPATRYLEPTEWAALERSSRGSFTGLGVLIAEHDAGFVVERCFPDSPAARAGIQAGDTVLGLLEPPLTPQTLDQLRGALDAAGRRGIVLALARGARRFDVRVEPGAVQIPSVESEELEGGLTLVRIRSFTESGTQELARVLGPARRARGVLLDLREDAGGVLDTAVEAAALLRGALPAVWVVDRQGHRVARSTERRPMLDSPPAVVLVDRRTASAAEVLAASLHRAGSLLVGDRTYGKGTVQEVFPLGDGGAAAITVARYEVEEGVPFPASGLQPDRPVTPPRGSAHTLVPGDPVLQAAIGLALGR